MRGSWAGLRLLAAAMLVVAACSGDGESTPDPVQTTATTSATDSSTTTTGDPGNGASGGSSRATTTTVEGDETTTSTGAGSTTSTTAAGGSTTTSAPRTGTLGVRAASQGCPQDLFVASGTRGAEFDAEVAAFPIDGGEPRWRLPLGYDYVVSRAHDETTVYLFLHSGLLLAIDAESCTEQWRLGLGKPSGIGLSEGVIVAADDRAIRAVSATDGSVLWSKDYPSGAPGAPLVLEDFAMVPRSGAPAVVGYSTIDGSRLYESTLSGWSGSINGITADFTAWYVTGNGRIAGRWIDDGDVLFDGTLPFDPGPPRLFSGTLYAAGSGPSGAVIGAYDYDLGEEIWLTDLGSATTVFPTAPGIEAGQVHVFDSSGTIHHLDLFTGDVLATGSYPAGAVRPEFDDLLFLVADRGTVEVFTLGEESVALLPTGADGADRVTDLDVVGTTLITETYDM